MYIKIKQVLSTHYVRYMVYAANHKKVMLSENIWIKAQRSDCVRAAKKMARRLGIEYRSK
jgi:hypothetical protein